MPSLCRGHSSRRPPSFEDEPTRCGQGAPDSVANECACSCSSVSKREVASFVERWVGRRSMPTASWLPMEESGGRTLWTQTLRRASTAWLAFERSMPHITRQLASRVCCGPIGTRSIVASPCDGGCWSCHHRVCLTSCVPRALRLCLVMPLLGLRYSKFVAMVLHCRLVFTSALSLISTNMFALVVAVVLRFDLLSFEPLVFGA